MCVCTLVGPPPKFNEDEDEVKDEDEDEDEDDNEDQDENEDKNFFKCEMGFVPM